MSVQDTPTLLETALSGLLQDLGKFMQRAFGAVRHMDLKARQQEVVILPLNGRGGYTHKHVLWTEAFFQRISFRQVSASHSSYSMAPLMFLSPIRHGAHFSADVAPRRELQACQSRWRHGAR